MEFHVRSNKLLLIAFFFLHTSYGGFAQNSILQRKINLELKNKQLDEVLDIISQKGRFHFSFNSTIIDKNKLIPSLVVKNSTVGDVLNGLFEGKIEAIESGRYVILRKKVANSNGKNNSLPPVTQKKKYAITGYVFNSATGERLPNATIYELGKTNSVLSNNDGFYRLTVTGKSDNLGLIYSRNNYKDTVLVIRPNNHSINMRLRPKEEIPEQIEGKKTTSVSDPAESLKKLEELPLAKMTVGRRQFKLSENLKFIEDKHYQISLLPHLGTNRLMSGNVENDISFNILGGYSNSVNIVEIGGLVNITQNHVKWAQIAGISNIVGGNVEGAQIAGIINNNRSSVKGAQIGGITNVVLDTITGLQLAGIVNVLHGRMNGLQLGGFGNFTTQHVDGVQLSGFMNRAQKDVRFAQLTGFVNIGQDVGGVQIAGFSNVGSDIGGAQLAGFINKSYGTVKGVQIAGFMNIAEKVNSSQLAGFMNKSNNEITGAQISPLNIAQNVKGVQLGVVNIADSVSGASVGFFSYVRQGIHKIEISLNESMYANISFKTGTHRFYNIFTTGSSINALDGSFWSLGYGLGSEFRKDKKFYFSLNTSINYVSEDFSSKPPVNVHYNLQPNIGLRLFKSSAVSIAPSINFLVSNWRDEAGNHLSTFAPYELMVNYYNDFKITAWLGNSIIFRF